jgi:pyruvyltransferase
MKTVLQSFHDLNVLSCSDSCESCGVKIPADVVWLFLHSQLSNSPEEVRKQFNSSLEAIAKEVNPKALAISDRLFLRNPQKFDWIMGIDDVQVQELLLFIAKNMPKILNWLGPHPSLFAEERRHFDLLLEKSVHLTVPRFPIGISSIRDFLGNPSSLPFFVAANRPIDQIGIKGNMGDGFVSSVAPFISGSHKWHLVNNSLPRTEPKILTLGSVLQRSQGNSVILGSGSHSLTSELQLDRTSLYVGVRGPRTVLQILFRSGVKTKSIGDPGILIREILGITKQSISNSENSRNIAGLFHAADKRKYKLNHKSSQFPILDNHRSLEKFVELILQSNLVLSSTLHGLIFADALNRKVMPVIMSSEIKGQLFKFQDYLDSVGDYESKIYPLKVEDLIHKEELIDMTNPLVSRFAGLETLKSPLRHAIENFGRQN